MMAVPMMLAGQPKSQAPPATWFFLVSGGEKRAEDEASTRKELKKIYTTILEQRLAESDHIVYLSGGQGMLSIDPMLRHSYEGSAATLLSAFLACSDELTAGWQRGHTKPNGLDVKDSAVVIFLGHGNEPRSWSMMPPSADERDASLGALVFINRNGNRTLYHPTLPRLRRTLFISLACYSGNAFQRVQLAGDKQTMMAVCLADPDHPASYDPILGQAFADFFKKDNPKDRTIMQFCDYLQEADYELERKEAVGWAVNEFEGYLPRMMSSDLWRRFQEVESLKKTVEDTKPDDLSQVARRKLSDHISKLDDLRFDLMRMYKHKPNNRFCLCGATDAIGKMTWREFLHLPADETDHELLPV